MQGAYSKHVNALVPKDVFSGASKEGCIPVYTCFADRCRLQTASVEPVSCATGKRLTSREPQFCRK